MGNMVFTDAEFYLFLGEYERTEPEKHHSLLSEYISRNNLEIDEYGECLIFDGDKMHRIQTNEPFEDELELCLVEKIDGDGLMIKLDKAGMDCPEFLDEYFDGYYSAWSVGSSETIITKKYSDLPEIVLTLSLDTRAVESSSALNSTSREVGFWNK